MTAYEEMQEYLNQNEDPEIDILVKMSIKILCESRESPQTFWVLPIAKMRELEVFTESAIISKFPMPVDVEQLCIAISMMSAGIVIQAGDKVIIPNPEIKVMGHNPNTDH